MRIEEAVNVTLRCIRSVVTFNGQLKTDHTLRAVGVRFASQVSALRDNVVHNQQIGVPSVNHVLDPVYLAALSKSWTVEDVITVVYNNSISGNRTPLAVRLANALERIQKA